MPAQTLTVALPDPLYARLQQRARPTNRTVEAELLDVLTSSVPDDEHLPPDLAASVAALDLLDDDALRRAAGTRLSADASARLEARHLKRQRDGLTSGEEGDRRELLRQYERAMLVRAHALAALRRRGLPLPDPPGP